MKSFIWITCILSFVTVSLSSQICSNNPRMLMNYPFSSPKGFYAGLNYFVNGETIRDKADSCLILLFDQFSNELTGISIEFKEEVSNEQSSIVRYTQFINDIDTRIGQELYPNKLNNL